MVSMSKSPPRMAPYNGAVEHTRGEFKSYLDCWSWKAAGADSPALLAECAAHDLNHQSRRCLGGGTACRAYFGGSRHPLLQAQAGVGLSLDPGGGGRDIHPGRQPCHHALRLARGHLEVVGNQRTDQDREVRKSVTPFLFQK